MDRVQRRFTAAPVRVADLGCGTGAVAEMALHRFPKNVRLPKRYAEDWPAKLSDHLAWLAEAGFTEPDRPASAETNAITLR